MGIRIIMREECDMWVAQCVDYDIAVQAPTLTECRRRMHDQMMVEAIHSEDVHGEAFKGIPAAPKEIEEIWNNIDAEGRFSESEEIETSKSSLKIQTKIAA